MTTHRRTRLCWLALALLATPALAAPGAAEDAAVGSPIGQGQGYASAVRLHHQARRAADGEILLVFERPDMAGVPLYASGDDGRTWTYRRRIVDQVHAGRPDWQLRWQPNLYELERSAGPLPAGALLLSANATRNDAKGRVVEEHLQVYASTDAGATWRYLSDIVDGGGRPEDRDNQGVWEPDLHVLPDGRLVAYYSSEKHKREGFNQLLAHKVSSDGGRTWGPEVIDVAHPGEVERPGMAIVQPLPGGRWVMSYEDIDGPDNGAVHLKFSDDALHWGDPADRGVEVRTASGGWPAASPIVRWIDDGSPKGVLVVLSMRGGGTGEPGGRTLYFNTDGGRGAWWQAPAPVHKLSGNQHAGWTQVFMPTADGRAFLHVTSSSSPTSPSDADRNTILSARAPVAFDRYEAEDALRRDAVQIETLKASSGAKLRIAVGGAATFPLVTGCRLAGALRLRSADVDLPETPRVTIDGRPVALGAAEPDGSDWSIRTGAVPQLAAGAHRVEVASAAHALDLDWIQLPLACSAAAR